MYCLDTALLIWGIQGKAKKSQSDMPARTRRFMGHCRQLRIPLIVPTPVWAEFLALIPPDEHEQYRVLLEKGFILAPFDVPAAELAATLEYENQQFKDLQAALGAKWDLSAREIRQMVKVDVQIAGIALHYGATAVITHDSHFERILRGRPVVASQIPDVTSGEQIPLFSRLTKKS